MSVAYTCPNPDCGVTLKTPNRVPPGKKVTCPKCGEKFVAEQEQPDAPPPPPPPGPGTFKFADDPKSKKKPKPPPDDADAPPASPARKVFADEEDDGKQSYGVVQESQEEIEQAEKNKPKFGEVQEKFKKSARGPAIALLVMPANLLTAEGLITAVGGLGLFLVGMWPLVFNDAPPGDEETEDAIIMMLLGLMAFGWGALICFGASMMHELGSYTWAMIGAVLGVLPLLVGIYALVMLQNPRVKAGFEEVVGAVDDEDEEEKEEEGEEEDEDDEDEDED